MNTIKLQQRGILTLPKKLRSALALEEGQLLKVSQKGNQIILEPQTTIDTELAAALKKGLADIKNGKFIEFSNTKELHQKLTRYAD